MEYARGLNVVILAKNPDVVGPVSGALHHTHEVQVFSGVGDALPSLSRRSPDVVIADLDLDVGIGGLLSLCSDPGSGPALLWVGLEPPPERDPDWQGLADWVPDALDPEALRYRVAHLAATRERLRELGRIQEAAGLGTFTWRAGSERIVWSARAREILGAPRGLARLSDFLECVDADDRERAEHALGITLEETGRCDLELRFRNGGERKPTIRMRALRERGSVRGMVEDVSVQADLFRRMRYLADHDGLTGLPNRRYFAERVAQCSAAAHRDGHEIALLYIDLDGFKAVNDGLGHAAGDALLSEIATRVMTHIRHSDSIGHLGSDDADGAASRLEGDDADGASSRLEGDDADSAASRLGGDEFAVLLARVDGPQGAEVVATRLAALIAEPVEIGDEEVLVSASIGISLFPLDATDAEDLLAHADQAMYQAKQKGPNNFAFYEEAMNTASARRLTLTSRLRHAIEEDHIRLCYQPRVELASGQIAGGEALARWDDPVLGTVSPGEFIPVAEGTGLIVPLGRAVLDRACRDIRSWLDRGLDDFLVSVNVSAQQFARDDILGWVSGALDRHRLMPRYLELEITESLFLGKTPKLEETLHQLREIGVRIALDDFGTGYSSLSYLLQFPIDTLKIDRCLLKGLPHRDDVAGVVRALLEMGKALGIRVVAEGVDEREQADWLIENGCHEMQGFLTSGAVEEAAFAEFLDSEALPAPRDP